MTDGLASPPVPGVVFVAGNQEDQAVDRNQKDKRKRQDGQPAHFAPPSLGGWFGGRHKPHASVLTRPA
jgi:hypothetical protein